MVLGGKKLEPFGMFTQTPIGLCLLATGILYFVVFGKFVLPAGDGKLDKSITVSLMEEYRGLEIFLKSMFQMTSPAIGLWVNWLFGQNFFRPSLP